VVVRYIAETSKAVRRLVFLVISVATSLVVLDAVIFDGHYLKVALETASDLNQSAKSDLDIEWKKWSRTSGVPIDGIDR
jgi:hypothetical protein